MKKSTLNNCISVTICSYGIMFLVLFITILVLILVFTIEPFKNIILLITNSFLEKKEIYQSTITSASILLGFTGTLISNIMNAKSKIQSSEKTSNDKELIEYFFHYANSKVFINTILTGITSGVLLIFFSLSLISLSGSDMAMYEMSYLILFMIWSAFLITFLLYEIQIFKIIITLLISTEKECNSYLQADTNEEIKKCFEAIDNNK